MALHARAQNAMSRSELAFIAPVVGPVILKCIISGQMKQRTDIGKYSFVNRTVKNWNQLPAEVLGSFPCTPKIFSRRVSKAIINGMK
jgi:hypothetical protein